MSNFRFPRHARVDLRIRRPCADVLELADKLDAQHALRLKRERDARRKLKHEKRQPQYERVSI